MTTPLALLLVMWDKPNTIEILKPARLCVYLQQDRNLIVITQWNLKRSVSRCDHNLLDIYQYNVLVLLHISLLLQHPRKTLSYISINLNRVKIY